MADNQTRVTATITAENTFTDWLQIYGGGRHFFDVSVSGISGDTVFLQRKRRDEADASARDVKSYTADTEEIGEVAGHWDYRLGVKTGGYSAGTILAELGV